MSPSLLLFDLYSGGHHAAYIEMLVDSWVRRDVAETLVVAAPRTVFEQHTRLANLIDRSPNVDAAPIDTSLTEGDQNLVDVLRVDLTHGRHLRELAATHRPSHILAMYFDHIQASTALRRIPPVPISGIYFRPSFHYREVNGRYSEAPGTRLRKRALLGGALLNRRVHRLFSLDPHVVSELGDPRVVWLPDGMQSRPATTTRAEQRARWSIDSGQAAILFFGVISARKGVHLVARAMNQLADDVRSRVALIVAGRIPESERSDVERSLASVREAGVRLIVDDRYLTDEDVASAFAGSDAALVAYRRHTGSSNVLIRAAAAGIPAIGSNYGLIGRQLEEYRLGRAVDCESETGLSGAIAEVVSSTLPGAIFDRVSAQAFAAANSADAFADTILNDLIPKLS